MVAAQLLTAGILLNPKLPFPSILLFYSFLAIKIQHFARKVQQQFYNPIYI